MVILPTSPVYAVRVGQLSQLAMNYIVNAAPKLPAPVAANIANSWAVSAAANSNISPTPQAVAADRFLQSLITRATGQSDGGGTDKSKIMWIVGGVAALFLLGVIGRK